MKKKHVNVVFPNIKNLGKRKWGKEDLLVLIPGLLSLKRIKIKKGSYDWFPPWGLLRIGRFSGPLPG